MRRTTTTDTGISNTFLSLTPVLRRPGYLRLGYLPIYLLASTTIGRIHSRSFFIALYIIKIAYIHYTQNTRKQAATQLSYTTFPHS